ncbi:MerR family transcriptional regulator [Pseudaestuariivita rosea]|uniref:MerR family transcriptional regulator n=1 Tax=Pseudaestuariivita rosea TaxID=2763263 RepID=UPI001ABAF16F|nr:MerR family transcriptional regulator [Pseudaestuariivita rosea]
MQKKARDAFRTISEVAEWLETPPHVLRFWESKFPQIRPVKRAGGRRYYRPSDMMLLGGIKKLLHEDGMTISAVKKMLQKEGVKHIAALGPSLEGGVTDNIADDAHIEDGDNVVPLAPAGADNLFQNEFLFDEVEQPVVARARNIPADPEDGSISVEPGILTALAQTDPATIRVRASQVRPVLEKLQALKDRMSEQVGG